MSDGNLEKVSISFDGNYQQLDQLLMRRGSYGHWAPTYPGRPKVYDYQNGVRLIWLARHKRIEIFGKDPRMVEAVEKHLSQMMKRYGFMDDTKALKRRLRDLVLALSPHATKRARVAKPRQPLRLTSQHKASASKPVPASSPTSRKPRSRA